MIQILKFIVCTILLLALVAAILIVCDAWSDRVFLAYVAIAALAMIACIWLYD